MFYSFFPVWANSTQMEVWPYVLQFFPIWANSTQMEVWPYVLQFFSYIGKLNTNVHSMFKVTGALTAI
jgi:hypothetical protein